MKNYPEIYERCIDDSSPFSATEQKLIDLLDDLPNQGLFNRVAEIIESLREAEFGNQDNATKG